MPTITTSLTRRTTILVTKATDETAEIAHSIRDGGGRFVVMDTDLAAGRRLVLSLNTGNGGVAVFLPGDAAHPADLEEALGECRRCWGAEKGIVLLAPAAAEQAA